MSDLSWSYTDGVGTVEFIPIGRAPVWKGDARTSEKQLIGTKTSEINVFGATSKRLQLSVLLDGQTDMLDLLTLDATQGVLTMDAGATKNVVLLVGQVASGELDGTFIAQITFVEVS
ncbi:hypothetical protein SE17_12945 [Kouleothrix aurantiaca]|uniref:Uncharacterized protein n=1 Tax=Kouleothrix aurantiaca TaxID=186479 RepID=A0A0N8PSJ0_9CHLR|nr:hypothetical protein SE17_12945 [Kouleothrix aurantiaca]